MAPAGKSGLIVETPGDTDVVVTRRFNAPLALVWRCYTEPELMKRWLIGSPGWEMSICDSDLRVGGTYHQRWRNKANGSEFGFVGDYLEIAAPNRIVSSERPDDMPDVPPAHNVLELTALGDMTQLVLTMSYADEATRQMVIETGMTDGIGLSFDMMDGVLAELG